MSRVADGLLDAAARIGQTLRETAYWHEGRCNWVGRSSRESAGTAPPFQITPTVAALGPELYAGSAGVALFLAQLHRVHPEAQVIETARGAARHALRKSEELQPHLARSFYSGPIGVAYAAAKTGEVAGDKALVEEGLHLASRAVLTRDGDGLLDVIGGSAGAIAPLIALSRLPGAEPLRLAAVALAEELACAATKTDDVWCWENERACGKGVGPTPLCGLAHGASGMGLALIEAASACGRSDWIEGGLSGFAYEDRLYDVEHGNWPDLREFASAEGETAGAPRGSTRARAPSRAPSFMVAWCHGAAGIGLARLRALQLLPARATELSEGAERAVAATRAQLDALPPGSDASLCHGRGGLAETLLLASTVRGDARQRRATAQMWTRLLKARDDDVEWTSGVPSGRSNPSLMLGLAGVGYSLLRAAAPDRVPSVLVIDPS